MKSTKTAALITAVVIVLSTLLGCNRSLNALRDQALAVFEQGEYGNGAGVRADLERRADVCANLCTLARNNGLDSADCIQALERRVKEFRAGDVDAQLSAPAQEVMDRLSAEELSEKDRRHLSNFQAELDSIQDTLRRDKYTQLARDFNEKTLTAFPANFLHKLAGVKPLPIYL